MGIFKNRKTNEDKEINFHKFFKMKVAILIRMI